MSSSPWTARHTAGIEALYAALRKATGPVQSVEQLRERLRALGWPQGPNAAADDPATAVQRQLSRCLVIQVAREQLEKGGASR